MGGSILGNLPFLRYLLNFACAFDTLPVFSSSPKNTRAASSPRSDNTFLYAFSAASPYFAFTSGAGGLPLGPVEFGSAPLGLDAVGFLGLSGLSGLPSGNKSSAVSPASSRSRSPLAAVSIPAMPPIARAIFPNASRRSSMVVSLPKIKSRPVPIASPMDFPNPTILSKTNCVLSRNVVSFSTFSGSDIHLRTSVVIAKVPILSKKLPIGPKKLSIQPRPVLAPLLIFSPNLPLGLSPFLFTALFVSALSSAAASSLLLSARRSAVTLNLSFLI